METIRDIAIVGLASRFPGAKTYREFWQNLATQQVHIREIPPDRWDWRLHYSPEPTPNKSTSKWGGFIEDIDKFEAVFFNISAPEATLMDPQQRIMLEMAWACLEDAGYNPRALAGSRTGVFVGACNYDYKELQEQQDARLKGHGSTGTFNTILPNRISFYFDFHGPSVPVDTSCSSSVVSVHQAVMALRNGECAQALAGGINLMLTPTSFVSFSQLGMLSPDGLCKTFDAGANGYVRGEGAAMLLLKPLPQALADHDTIYGVIKGTATNHGGRVRTLTAPNARAQAEVVAQAIADAGITADTITHVETHGTGTQLGDPVEVWGLKQAFSRSMPHPTATPFCGLGSVKTNIGHLEAAAGVASIVKVLLALKHQQLPGTPNFQTQNPRINLADSPFYILTELTPWKADSPRRAGVSSFGFGGANAHLVIEEAPPVDMPQVEPLYLFVLSAADEAHLMAQAQQMRDFLRSEDELPALAAMAYTLQVGRAAFDERLAIVAADTDMLVARLTRALTGESDGKVIYRGNIRTSDNPLMAGDTGQSLAPMLLETRDYRKLAQLWTTSDTAIDWTQLYAEQPPYRVSLPTYPFAGKRFWLAESALRVPQPPQQAPARHITLTGAEFFLTDHQVHGQAMLPGVMTLELARAASDNPVTHLRDIVWLRPITAPAEVHITLTDTAFQINTGDGVLCTQGKLDDTPVKSPPTVDIAAIRQRCPTIYNKSTCYERFRQGGLMYGLAFQGLVEVAVGDGEALARLRLPESVANTANQYPLHPSLLDSALQTTMLLTPSDGPLPLPFSLTTVEIIRPVATVGYAYAKQLDAGHFDVILLDEQGQPSLIIRDFAVRIAAVAPETTKPVETDPVAIVEQIIAGHVSDLLDLPLDGIAPDFSFADHGVDSILGVDLVNRISGTLDLTLRTTSLFDFPNVQTLAQHIINTYNPTLPQVATIPVVSQITPVMQPQPTQPAGWQDIAIIGLAGRFPGADNLAEFWALLSQGRSAITQTPPERWSIADYYHPDSTVPRKTYSKWGGFLNDVDKFDPLFFKISGREAELMDPQQRLFLQTCWATLEDAGYGPDSLDERRVGVFLGSGSSGDYYLKLSHAGIEEQAYAFMGNDASIAAARIAYLLNLKGPSMAIDTACSASLVAIHLACQSLNQGESEMALAGGVFVTTTPNFHILTSKAGMLSPVGVCKTFDDAADGFVPGEAVAALMLKPLAQAEADGDHIYGVIKGSGINQDGRTNGITAPSTASQTALAQMVYTQSGLNPDTISYVECHGTGTKLGDPIEIEALTNAFRTYTNRKQFCAVGSVKTNIGHTSTAAGIAGVAKVLLAFQHRQLPPSINYQTPNSHIDFENSPFYVNDTLRPWAATNGPRRAAVSSFGFSGTNAHLILEEYAAPPVISADGPQLIVLSARNAERLHVYAAILLDFLVEPVSLLAMAYTLQVGREAMETRLAFVAADVETVKAGLRQFLAGDVGPLTLYQGEVHVKAGHRTAPLASSSLAQAAQHWVNGGSVDWASYYPTLPRRILLPTYPFARERYWITASTQPMPVVTPINGTYTSIPAPRDTPVAPVPAYQPFWQPESLSPAQTIASEGAMLIIAPPEASPLADALAEAHAQQQPIIAETLPAQLPLLDTIYFLDGWAATAHTCDHAALGLFNLVKSLNNHNTYPARLKVITRQTQAVHPTDSIQPWSAALIGLTMTLASEYPSVDVGCLDIASLTRTDIAAIVAEHGSSGRPIAIRDGRRYVQRLRLATNNLTSTASPYRPGGVYLILGGAGGLGLETSVHLARQVGARLVLVGRSELTPDKITQLDRISAAGGDYLYCQADGTDLAQMQAVVRQAHDYFGPINGVIHAAIVLRDATVRTMDEATLRMALAPKLQASLALYKAVQNEPLDFMVFFSSAQSFLGSAGQGNYAAGCTFKDAFGLSLAQQHPYPVRVINWGYWGEVGVVASPEYRQRLAQRGIYSIGVAEGLDALTRVLSNSLEQVVVINAEPPVLSQLGLQSQPTMQGLLAQLKTDAVHLFQQMTE